MNQKGFAPIVILFVILGVLVVLGGTYYLLHKPTTSQSVQNQTASSTSDSVVQPSSSVNSSWEQVYVSSTGLTFSMPNFGVPYNINVTTSTEGSFMAVQLENTSSFYVTEFHLSVYNNPTKLNLHDWFEQNVDDEGVLLAQNGYKQETLSNGSSVYVFVSSAPLSTIQGFDGYGPGILLTAFTQSTTTGEIIGVDGSQAGDLYNYGFPTQDSEIQLRLSILGTARL